MVSHYYTNTSNRMVNVAFRMVKKIAVIIETSFAFAINDVSINLKRYFTACSQSFRYTVSKN